VPALIDADAEQTAAVAAEHFGGTPTLRVLQR
jgi:hypothetical protein